MFMHFLKLAFRNLCKHKRNTIINLIGLSLGIAILLVISIFASNELNVDKFHEKADQICKISYGTSSGTPGPLADLLEQNFPEIQQACHLETHQLPVPRPQYPG